MKTVAIFSLVAGATALRVGQMNTDHDDVSPESGVYYSPGGLPDIYDGSFVQSFLSDDNDLPDASVTTPLSDMLFKIDPSIPVILVREGDSLVGIVPPTRLRQLLEI